MAQTTERLPNGLLLHQDDRYFKLGQDSVLLSSFARPRRNAGKNAPAPERRAARQDGTCTVEDLAVACSFVLHTGGKAAVVFRPERMWTLLEALARVRLVPKRLRFVHQTAQAAPSAVLVECRKGGSAEGLSVEPPLLVQSEEYNKIYKK